MAEGEEVMEEIKLKEHRAMVTLPENSVCVEMNCRVFHDGEIINVSKTLSMEDVRTAFQKADDGYMDDDDRFTLTEKGLKWLEENGEQ